VKYLKIRNWEKYQHYKDRNPPWIKLYHTLLDDYEYSCLQDDSKLLLFSLYLVASRCNNIIPMDIEWIKKRTNINGNVDFKELQDAGFIKTIKNDSNVIAERKQDACLETETETDKEEDIPSFKFNKKVPLPANIYLTERMRLYVKKQGCENSNHAESLFEDFCINQKKRNMKWNDWTMAFYSWVRNDKKMYNADKYKEREFVCK